MTTDITPTPAAKPTDEQMLQAHARHLANIEAAAVAYEDAVAAEKAAIAISCTASPISFLDVLSRSPNHQP